MLFSFFAPVRILFIFSFLTLSFLTTAYAQSQLGDITVNETTHCATTSIGQLCDGDIISSELLSPSYDDTLTNNIVLGVNIGGKWAGEQTFTQGTAPNNGYETNPTHLPATTKVHIITKQDANNPVGNVILKNGSTRDFSGNTNQLIIVSKDVGTLAYFGGVGTTTINSDETSATILVGENGGSLAFTRINLHNHLLITGKVLILDAISLESSRPATDPQPVVKALHEGYAQSIVVMNGRTLTDMTFGLQNANRGCKYSIWNTCYSPGDATPFYKNIAYKNAYATEMGYKVDVLYASFAGMSLPAISVSIDNSILKTVGRSLNGDPWRRDDGTAILQLRNSIISGNASNGSISLLYARGASDIKGLNQSVYKSYISNFTNVTLQSGPDTDSPIIFNNGTVSLNGGDAKSYQSAFLYNNTSIALGVPIYSSLLFNNGNQNSFAVDGSHRMTALNTFFSYNFTVVPNFVSSYPSCGSNLTNIGVVTNNCDITYLSRNFVSSGITP